MHSKMKAPIVHLLLPRITRYSQDQGGPLLCPKTRIQQAPRATQILLPASNPAESPQSAALPASLTWGPVSRIQHGATLPRRPTPTSLRTEQPEASPPRVSASESRPPSSHSSPPGPRTSPERRMLSPHAFPRKGGVKLYPKGMTFPAHQASLPGTQRMDGCRQQKPGRAQRCF